MKVLVTGAAGFIGFYVARAYAAQGIEVVGLDNINDYYDINLKYERLEQTGINRFLINENVGTISSDKYPNYRFAKIDISDSDKLLKLFVEEQFTHVVHLAAQAGVRYSIENPYTYIQTNVVGFLNILEGCRHNNVQHLVYASSSSVYGNSKNIPFSEDQRVDCPISLYAATKKSNELMAYTYSHLYDIPVTGLRFFTVYGPWGRPDMAPMLFASAIHKGDPINVFNYGDMERDFTYVDDIVEGVMKIVPQTPSKIPKVEVYNIGNSKPIKLMDFIKGIEDALGKKAIKNYMPMQDGDVQVTYADSSKLERAIKYKPEKSLAKGISDFIKWFKEYKK